MKASFFASALAVLIGIGSSDPAYAVIGPTQAPLKVAAMYTVNNSAAIYVQFQPGSMPGCYANAGGYIWRTNTYFKELLAQLMAMQATGGIGAAVVYTQNTPTNNWGDCTIDGLYLLP